MSQKKSKDNLNDQMEDFCFHFVYTHVEDAVESVKQVYSISNPYEINRKAKKLLEHPGIQAKITELRETKGKSKLVDKHYVIKKLKAIVDDENEPTKEKLKALELIGKYLKMFTDKVIEKEVNISEDLAQKASMERMRREKEEAEKQNMTVEEESDKFIKMRQKNG